MPSLLSWLSARQYAPEGGFSGRTNKLVDGCYSHWVGSCWPLVQSALHGAQSASGPLPPPASNLYSREGLARYILGCCQSKKGGLRDKPGKYVAPSTARLNMWQEKNLTIGQAPGLVSYMLHLDGVK